MKLSSEVMKFKDEIRDLRRALHKIPETGFEEYKTKDFIVKYLTALNPDKLEFLAGTGVKAVFYGRDIKKAIAFRADIDALPIHEENKKDYVSQHAGVMHACGHDGHMAILLAFGKLISMKKQDLKRSVVLIFQPAEENAGGAQDMIKEGALASPKVEEIYAIHLWPDVPAGKFSLRSGEVMARMCDVDIEIYGKGAHGANPHLGIDAMVAGAHLIGMLQTVISRNLAPYEQAVMTIGKIEGGTARNIICDWISLQGTVRAFNETIFNNARQRLRDIVKSLETAFSVKTEYIEAAIFPAVANHPKLAEKAAALLDKDDFFDLKPMMASEDFAFYQQHIPGLFIFLGIADTVHKEPLHSCMFDFDEQGLLNGLEFYKRLAEI